jgi:hypothetical protein
MEADRCMHFSQLRQRRTSNPDVYGAVSLPKRTHDVKHRNPERATYHVFRNLAVGNVLRKTQPNHVANIRRKLLAHVVRL